jgi:hypothetical protein
LGRWRRQDLVGTGAPVLFPLTFIKRNEFDRIVDRRPHDIDSERSEREGEANLKHIESVVPDIVEELIGQTVEHLLPQIHSLLRLPRDHRRKHGGAPLKKSAQERVARFVIARFSS